MATIGSRVTTKTGRKGIIRFIGGIGNDVNRYFIEWDDSLRVISSKSLEEINDLNEITWKKQIKTIENNEQKQLENNSEEDVSHETEVEDAELAEIVGEDTEHMAEDDSAKIMDAKQAGLSETEGEASKKSSANQATDTTSVYNEGKFDFKSNKDHKIETQAETLDNILKELSIGNGSRPGENDHLKNKLNYYFKRVYEKPKANDDTHYHISKIKNILKDNKEKRVIKNQKSGNLCFKKLWKVNLSERLFQKKGIISDKEYNIALLIDSSGSMSGKRCIESTKTVDLFISEFQKFCNISISVFSDYYKLVKPFKANNYCEKQINTLCKFLVMNTEINYGSTNEALGIREITKTFRGMKGKNIVICICDGEPDSGKELKDELKIANNNDISCIGIGIQTTSVEYYYENNAVIKDYTEIFSAVTKCLSKVMKRNIY